MGQMTNLADVLRPLLTIMVATAFVVSMACDGTTRPPPASPAPTPIAVLVATSAPTSTPFPMLTAIPTLTPPPTLTPLPTLTPEVTPAAGAVPTANPAARIYTPLPPSGASYNDPASWTDNQVSDAVINALQESLAAITAQPEPQYDRAMASYSATCERDAQEFAVYVDNLRKFIGTAEAELNILSVNRLLPDQAFVSSELWLDGSPVLGLDRSLFQLEGGRWVSISC